MKNMHYDAEVSATPPEGHMINCPMLFVGCSRRSLKLGYRVFIEIYALLLQLRCIKSVGHPTAYLDSCTSDCHDSKHVSVVHRPYSSSPHVQSSFDVVCLLHMWLRLPSDINHFCHKRTSQHHIHSLQSEGDKVHEVEGAGH